MSHQINDQIFDTINDEWTDMSVEDLKDWLATHREIDMVAKVVHDNLDSLEEKWKQEMLDSYPHI